MIDIEKILTDCAEYISQLKKCPKGYFLYRGSHYQIPDAKWFESRLKERAPVNTPQVLHDQVNNTFESQFGWKIRNGVFCYGFTSLEKIPEDLGYGTQYLCFPIGGFEFVYSPKYFDLCGYFHELNYQISENEISELIFKNETLEGAIDSNKHRNGLSNEISVKAEAYYLIDINYRIELADIIWPIKVV